MLQSNLYYSVAGKSVKRNMATEEKKLKNSTIWIGTIITFAIVTLLSLIMTVYFIAEMKTEHKEYIQKYEKQLETIQKSLSNNKTIKIINFEKKSEDNYKDFLEKYYTGQNNWLNIWLTILAIALGVMGIIFPLLFADKKKEMDEIIAKGEKAIDDIKKQASKEFEEYKKDIDDKLINFDKDLQKVVNSVKEVEESKKKAEASVNFAMAFKCHDKNKLNEAIDYYNKAIELSPNFKEAYYNRGIAYIKQENYPRAIEDYNKAIELSPNFKEAYYNRGIAYFKQGNYPRAIEDYDKAIELNPNDDDAYCSRGVAYFKQGNCSRAIEDYNKAIELNPNNYQVYANRGSTYDEQEKYHLAMESYNKAIELNPNDDGLYCNRSVSYIKQSDYPLAIEDLNKAIELNPNCKNAYYNLTEVYIYNKQFNKALESLNLFQKKEPQPFIFIDDYDKWMQGLNESPENPDVKQIKEIIETKLIRKNR